jgi:hypothetical protein
MNIRKKSAALIIISLLVTAGHLQPEVYYPWKEVFIGALDGKAWLGLVFAPLKDAAFAFRFAIEKDGTVADGNDLDYLVTEVGPHSPDGQYARVRLDVSLSFNQGDNTPILIKPVSNKNTVLLEWSRQDERTIIGRIRGPKDIKLRLIHYFPWTFEGGYRFLPEGEIQGESLPSKAVRYLFWADHGGDPLSGPEGAELGLSFNLKNEQSIYFAAGVGEDAKVVQNHLYRYKNRKTIDSLLREEESRYNNRRTRLTGLYGGTEEAITNNLFWMILYQPGSHRLYTPAGRKWMFPQPEGAPDHWTIFEWDSFFNALEVSMESSKLARDIVTAVLETQYPNGNIPNWRSRSNGTPDRSQPPVGAYVVMKLFGKMGGLDLLQTAYPYLIKWHSFWKEKKPDGRIRRDGNGDGLLEWGSDADLVAQRKFPTWEENAPGKTRAMWESGQDDLPNWEEASFNEETGTLTMNCVDLNSLYALDAWCLGQMASILNFPQDSDAFMEEYQAMKELINKKLWNENEEFYFDRHWDGRFSTRKAASNFYPLLARIPDEKRVQKMIKRLLNSKEYWGDFVIPTISRDDPAFKDQQYWRGTIWPPTNYLVYQGLKACGQDTVASEFAAKSTDLFLKTWKNFQLCPENFDSRTGEAGGQRYQSWGPLFALIGLEEYLDFTPWDGFRFGILKPENKGKLSRIAIQGRHYDVEVSSSKVKLREENKDIFTADGGAVIRHFLYSEGEIAFEIKSLEKRDIELRFLKKGKYQLSIDGQEKKIFRGNSLDLEVPEGDHSVLILLLKEED